MANRNACDAPNEAIWDFLGSQRFRLLLSVKLVMVSVRALPFTAAARSFLGLRLIVTVRPALHNRTKVKENPEAPE